MRAYDLSNARWRKSSYSDGDGGNCVEVLDDVPGVVPVRDSKNPTGPALLVPVTICRTVPTALGAAAVLALAAGLVGGWPYGVAAAVPIPTGSS
ncbi:hypothetical protein AQF52_2745 [Streptomyces venezuelae]|uniref:DUF397 domain-containing protein n=1 Tax=Streptomyces gardneri TaxID=66892 RepID=UPI0006BC8E8B|nr:hypothetical protein AQF52_2745 [Streptomyces venezuelae]QPK45561.1 DUF397 domain-containing protein [Streptomyces gardneri]CUM41306.1 hypothetical protein BN2537_11577 [Streptomyces venezuelae]